jgi:hypothetical protein
MSSLRKVLLLATLALAAFMTVGATGALAHGGPGLVRGTDAAHLVAAAAKELGVTPASLTADIRAAAVSRIDEAVTDTDLDAADAPDLKDNVANDLGYAISISRTKTVADNAGKTVAQVNSAFRAARKALYVAAIDKAVTDGDLTAAQATTLKTRLDKATLAGYKPVGRGFGFGAFGGHFDEGHRRGHGGGFGS